MKPHEIRGLPTEEIKGMLTEAENTLFQSRFQMATGQLENKLKVGESKKEIAIMKTVLKEEEIKLELAKANSMLNEISSKFQIPEVANVIKGEKINFDKAKLRKAVSRLRMHPRKKEFNTEYQTLKKMAVK
ncbi:50S ribosomal protein L29 [bacterium]|nr:MAG: 50S ribosomal protein L29 [bacterium]